MTPRGRRNLIRFERQLETERVNEIEESQDGKTCKYRTWITYDGFTAGSTKKKYGEALREGIQDFCLDLKRRSEKIYKEETT